MKKIIYFLSLGLLATACHEDVSKGEKDGFQVPSNFEWKTLQREKVTLTTPSSVYLVGQNGKEDLLAEKLPAGTYSFAVGTGKELKVVETTTFDARSMSRAGENGKIYFPGSGYATMLVEDIFPYKGDMDMNDVVLGFRFEYVLAEGSNVAVKSLIVHLEPWALGGAQYNTIGVALQFAGLKPFYAGISSIEGQNGMGGVIFPSLNADKTETGAPNCVPLIGNLYDCFDKHEGFVNTVPDFPRYSANEIVVTINFDEASMPEYGQLQLVPESGGGNMIDLFVTLGSRGKEVHLKGNPQTALIDSQFKEYASYASPENYVWALVIDDKFKYAQEGKAIYDVYPNFVKWINGEITDMDEWTFWHNDFIYM